jgi:hypothetical protein
MNLFIAVVFFCTGAECYFWKSPVNHYNKEECIAAIEKFASVLEQNGVVSFGQCLVVNTRNDI